MKTLLIVLVVVMFSASAYAKGESCQGNWSCSWDEYCHKPSWKQGTCVEKP